MASKAMNQRLLSLPTSSITVSKRMMMILTIRRPIVTNQKDNTKEQQQKFLNGLYNNENHSVLDHLHNSSSPKVYHAASDHHHHRSQLGSTDADIFSPTVNTIFDE